MARKKSTKKTGKRRTKSASAVRSTTRARKKGAKKKPVKKKRLRKKPTKVEKRARRPQNRKPETNGKNHKEIVDLFPGTNTRSMTAEQTHELQMAFCRSFATRGIVRDACIATGISRRTYYQWRKKDASFDDNCKMAEEMSADIIEREALRRAVEGYDHPVIYQGEITDTYTEYSDSLMSMLLRGNKQAKYKERTEYSGSVGRPMTLDEETKEDLVASILGMIKSKPDPK